MSPAAKPAPIVTGAAPLRADLLTASQLVKISVIGVSFWFAGTVIVKYAGTAGWLEGSALAVLYALGVLIGAVTVWFAKWFARMSRAQVVSGLAVGTGVAICCDGTALIVARGLYGATAELVLPGAAWILWVGGWGLLIAYLEAMRPMEG